MYVCIILKATHTPQTSEEKYFLLQTISINISNEMMINFDSSSSDQTYTIHFVSEFSIRAASGHSTMPKGIAFSVPQAKLNVRLIFPGTTIIHFPFRFTERGQLWSGQRNNLGGVKLTKSIKRPTQNSRAVGRTLHAVHWTCGQTIGSPNFSCLGHVRVPSVGFFLLLFR